MVRESSTANTLLAMSLPRGFCPSLQFDLRPERQRLHFRIGWRRGKECCQTPSLERRDKPVGSCVDLELACPAVQPAENLNDARVHFIEFPGLHMNALVRDDYRL